jgi:hypothetical protein
MKLQTNKISTLVLCIFSFVLSALSFHAFAQDNIRVQGKITDIATGEPIAAVNIIEDGYVVAYSDIDGNYSCTVSRSGELIFYSGQHEEVKVKVDNRQVINVQMQVLTIQLSEAVVTASYGNTTVYVEPSDLQLVGDHFVLKTSVRIPRRKFDMNSRFIFQPTLYNATLKDTSYFRPVVIDGEKYHINQQRYFSFDDSKDKLADYVVTNDLAETDHIYSYRDSIYVPPTDINHDYRSDCYLGINGLFRKETIGNIFRRKFNSMANHGFRNAHVMEALNFLAVIIKDFYRFFNRRFFDFNLLETSRQTLVFRNVAGVILVRCCTNEAERTAINIRFQEM